MANKKLICFDLDGTLLNSQRQVSPLNIQLLQRLEEAGHVVSIATGRLYKSACKIRNLIPTELEIICSNGAVVENAGKIIRRDQIPPQILEGLYLMARDHDVSLAFDSLYAVYHTKLGWTFLMNHFSNVINTGNLHIRNIHVRSLEQYMKYAPFYINGIVISRTAPDKIVGLRRELEALDLFNIESSAHNNVEIMPKGSNKGKGALILAERHGIYPEDIIAFGDGENDLKLIETAGVGIAMGNASDLLKSRADLIIGNNDSDAIARTLENLIGITLDKVRETSGTDQ